MMSKSDSIKWLQKRTEGYRATTKDTGEIVEDFDDVGKLGSGFMSVDELEEVDIGDGSGSHPTYVNAALPREQKTEVCELLKEYTDCFAWSSLQQKPLIETLCYRHFLNLPLYKL
jgi:hypothetical protein